LVDDDLTIAPSPPPPPPLAGWLGLVKNAVCWFAGGVSIIPDEADNDDVVLL
jgi:hypothetical protein